MSFFTPRNYTACVWVASGHVPASLLRHVLCLPSRNTYGEQLYKSFVYAESIVALMLKAMSKSEVCLVCVQDVENNRLRTPADLPNPQKNKFCGSEMGACQL